MSGKKLVTSAQGYKAMSNLFFVDTKTKNIRVYITQEEPEVDPDNARNYTQDFVETDGSDGKPPRITVSSTDLAALAYALGNDTATTNTRLYYADSDGLLQELCRDTDKKTWYRGSLGSTVFVLCAPDTPISAHINFNSKQLKVYTYSQDNANTPTVTWVTVGKTDWQTKLIVK